MLIRKLGIVLTLIFCAAAPAIAAFGIFQTANNSGGALGTFVLPRGGGGWNVGIDAAQDGNLVTHVDVGLPYALDKASKTWSNVSTFSSMPRANFGFYPATGSSQQQIGGAGIYDIRQCPSNSSIMYMMNTSGNIFTTSNRGVAWTKTNFTAVNIFANGNYRMNGAKMAVDPNSCSHVLMGTDMNGVWETTNGGTSWTQKTSIPASVPDENIRTFTTCTGLSGGNTITCISTNAVAGDGIADKTNPAAFPGSVVVSNISNVITLNNNLTANVLSTDVLYANIYYNDNGRFPSYNIAFDPASGITGGVTNIVVIAGAGFSPYKTSNGSTYSATSGGPTLMQHMVFAPSGGALYACSEINGTNTGTIRKFVSSTWTTPTQPNPYFCHSIAVDPADITHIVSVADNGGLANSTDSGVTWAGFSNPLRSCPVGEPQWLCATNEFYMSNGDIAFDASNPNICGTASNCLASGEGIGVWYATPSNGATVTWSSVTKGIESLVGQAVAVTNGNVMTGFQDRATFTNNLSTFPAGTNWTLDSVPWSLMVTFDYAIAPTNKNFVAAVNTPYTFGYNQNTAFSLDSGVTWKPFNRYYQDVAASALADDGAGLIKITVPSTTGLATYTVSGSGAPGETTNTMVRLVGYGGATTPQAGATFGGERYYGITVNDGTHFTLQNSAYSSVYSAAGRFYVYVDSSPITDHNGLFVITNIANSGSGEIRVTVVNSQGGFVNGVRVCISGAVTATEANGCWVAYNVSGNSFDLLGSAFSHTDTTGTSKWWPPAGGYIAAASDQNILYVPANNSFPFCTTDQGQTWTEMKVPSGTTTGGSTGWTFAIYANAHAAAADTVTANKIYAYNSGVVTGDSASGVYATTNCSTLTQVSNTFISNSGTQTWLRAVPGNAGHLFISAGPIGTSTHPAGASLYKSINGGSTFAPLPSIAEPWYISFGAVAPGKTYPTLFVPGWIDRGSGYEYGIWRSTDSDQATPTWTKVEDYPLGSPDNISAIGADDQTWNKWYGCWSGSGCFKSQQNYLLERDLNPPSNDNSPLGLGKVG